ncbi:hypothetical protein MUK42_27150 [Musa troglodytarum]|uniref:Uncharacterized protein n=1 Tax=Musa troglodytarum TaxID=320322 RepID=A0A9E7FV16_9LILI|nr:hypothetical protein MUK42_27150 [Musa troglodytarum]
MTETAKRLLRCGKSCRLRWMLADIKRGSFTKEEEEAIISLEQAHTCCLLEGYESSIQERIIPPLSQQPNSSMSTFHKLDALML